jgi:hypothetical protein
MRDSFGVGIAAPVVGVRGDCCSSYLRAWWLWLTGLLEV